MTTPPPPAGPPAGAASTVPGAVPLWAPLYGASFGAAVSRYWRKYARFDGRASRSEYWWWALANALVVIVLYVLTLTLGITGSTPTGRGGSMPGPLFWLPASLLGLWWLGTIVPNIAIIVRRLHDTGQSGWFFLLSLIPGVGGIIMLILTLMPSSPQGMRFDDPSRG